MDIGSLLGEKYYRRYPTHISIGSTPCTRSFCPIPERGVKTRTELLFRWGVFPHWTWSGHISKGENCERVVREPDLPDHLPCVTTLASGLRKVTGSHMKEQQSGFHLHTPREKRCPNSCGGKSHWPRDLGFEQVEVSAGVSLAQKSQAEMEIYSLVTCPQPPLLAAKAWEILCACCISKAGRAPNRPLLWKDKSNLMFAKHIQDFFMLFNINL